nr:YhdP family protein [uncultured Rhodoferax sp.]
MNELISAPSLRLRVVAVLAKWALRVLALAWLAVGLLWCGLHFVIVPRIAEFRPWAEAQATKALGLQVRIGGMQARSNGVIPSIDFLRVAIFDRAGREALLLPRISAALSPRSILGGGFEQVFIDSPALDIRRTSDGTWWVAGLAVTTGEMQDGAAADWLFSQAEVAVVNGRITWTDETRAVEPVTFEKVNVVVRNRLRTHSLRLDADPPEHWGDRLSVQGVFRQPLLTRHPGQWSEWDGQAYADFSRVDLAELGRYVDLGVQLAQGSGVIRAWVDVLRGKPAGAVADVSLSQVNLRAGATLEPLALASVSGRLGAKVLAGGSEFSTESLQFVTQDGLHWPGGNVRVQLFAASKKEAEHGTMTADRLDLAALAQIAGRLPLDASAHALLQRLDPKGIVDGLEASWQGPVSAPQTYKAQGKVSQLSLPSCHCEADLRPGVQGLDVEFDMDQTGGKARLALRNGMVDANGVFEEALIPLDQFSADLRWELEGPRVSVSGSNVRFSNADAQGELGFAWQSAVSGNAMTGPGSLELQGMLSRADAARIARYLPVVMERESLDYVRAALLGGMASNVQFKVKGDLARFPYRTGQSGDFRISASVKNGSFAFAPAHVMPKDSLPWPVLNQLSGEFVLDRDVLQVKVQRGVIGTTGLQIGKTEAQVSNLYDAAMVSVTAEAKGALPEALSVVNASPLGPLMEHALAQAVATGSADYRLKLGFPVSDVEKIAVQGSVVLGGNDLQILPDTPKLSRARGTIHFTESGFSLAGAQARALGGDVKLDGGLTFVTGVNSAAPLRAAPNQLRFSGTASAEGLRQSTELGPVTRLAQFATGSAAYSASLGFQSGVAELHINSTLLGMGVNLPAPLAKTAESSLPVRFESALLRPAATATASAGLRDRLQLDIGKLAAVTFVRDLSGPQPKVLSGVLAVGVAPDESTPLPDEGVVANIQSARLDVDAWSAVADTLSADVSSSPGAAPAPHGDLDTSGYMPTVLVLRAQELLVSGRQLNHVVAGGSREGPVWRANLDATELSGYVEYRQPDAANAGRLYARLARLSIGQSSAQDVESLLDEQPSAIPALDIEVDDFVLRGKKLGRIDIEAVNLGSAGTREWRLNRFNIQTPEAQLTASGNWASINATATSVGKSIRERRRTVLNFKLDINDSGELLTRLGMPGVVGKGNGKVEGQVAWAGSPITVDYPSMSGKFNVNVETGQFLKADPGIAKLLGVLSLQSLPRRLTLDFRDVFSEGFAFDFFRGDIAIEQGIAKTSNLQMKGVNAAVLMDGQADIAKETQNLRVVVVPEINAGSASLIASAINPVVGLSTFLAQLLLRGPLVNAATQEFIVDGTWLDPKVTQVPRKP